MKKAGRRRDGIILEWKRKKRMQEMAGISPDVEGQSDELNGEQDGFERDERERTMDDGDLVNSKFEGGKMYAIANNGHSYILTVVDMKGPDFMYAFIDDNESQEDPVRLAKQYMQNGEMKRW